MNFKLDSIKKCACGKCHSSSVEEIIIEKGAIKRIVQVLNRYAAKKAFILADKNTYNAAGRQICHVLDKNNIDYLTYMFQDAALEPDERAVGSAVMHYNCQCDIIIGIGSGVINDIGKILAKITGKPFIIIATAPSMDGYASASSSMCMDGLKVSLPTKPPNVIIGDIDILKAAPMRMLQAGLGDMLAKYISICEWRIAHIIREEYYCETVATLVRNALKKCVSNASGLLKREERALEAVFSGLIISGAAMEYAGCSRPASGVEHYFSHIWDMRGLAFSTPVDLHGIQCAIGTLYAARIYKQLKDITPDRDKAQNYAESFDICQWNKIMRGFLGKGADSMIELETKEQKYDTQKHKKRLSVLLSNWDTILQIIDEEIPSLQQLENLFQVASLPKSCGEIGMEEQYTPMCFRVTKDIRDKYVLSSLCWDLGIIDEIKF